RPVPAPGASRPSRAWNRCSSAGGALRPQPAQVLVGALLAAVLALLGAGDVLDRDAAVRVVDDVRERPPAGVERLVLAVDRRVAGAGGERFRLGIAELG